MAEPRTRDLFLLQNDPETEKEIKKLADYYKISIDQAKGMYLSDGLKLEDTPSYQTAVQMKEVTPEEPVYRGVTGRVSAEKLEDLITVYDKPPKQEIANPEEELKRLKENKAKGLYDKKVYFEKKKEILDQMPEFEVGKEPRQPYDLLLQEYVEMIHEAEGKKNPAIMSYGEYDEKKGITKHLEKSESELKKLIKDDIGAARRKQFDRMIEEGLKKAKFGGAVNFRVAAQMLKRLVDDKQIQQSELKDYRSRLEDAYKQTLTKDVVAKEKTRVAENVERFDVVLENFINSHIEHLVDVEGMSVADAVKEADKEKARIEKAFTVEFRNIPKFGTSDLVISEEGDILIYDRVSRKYRKPKGFKEKFFNVLKRQKIGTADFIEKARQTLIREQIDRLEGNIHYKDEPAKRISEAAQLYESPFGATLRNVFMGPEAALTALLQPTQKGKGKYIRAKSGTWADQFIINHAKWQGLPELAQDTESAKELSDMIGLTWATRGLGISEDWGPFTLGAIASAPMPLTPIGVGARLAGAAGRTAGTTLRAVGSVADMPKVSEVLMKTGAIINKISNPLETLKSNALLNRVDKMVDEIDVVNVKQRIKEFEKDPSKYTKEEWGRVWDAEMDRRNLVDLTADALGENLSTLALTKGMLDAGKSLDEIITAVPSAEGFIRSLHTEAKAGKIHLGDRGLLKKVIDNRMKRMQEAAGKDPVLRAAYNQAFHVEKMVKNIDQIKSQQELSRFWEQATALNKPFNDELFKVQMVMKGYDQKTIRTFFTDLAKLPPAERTAKNMEKLLGKLEPWHATPQDINIALARSLSKTYKKGLLDWMPVNLVNVRGSIFAPLAKVKNKKNIAQYKKEYTSLIGADQLSESAQTGFTKINNGEKISEILIEEVGSARIRASEMYMDLLKKLANPDEEYSITEMIFIKDHIVGQHLARKHFGGFELGSGQQLERALIAPELRGSLIGIGSRESYTYQPSSLKLAASDLSRVFKSIVRNNTEFNKTVTTSSKTPEIKALYGRLKNVNKQIDKNFIDEVRSVTKETGDPAIALDVAIGKSWDIVVRNKETQLQELVDTFYDGSWKNYVNSLDYSRTIQRDVRERFSSGMSEGQVEELYKDLAVDYELYLEKSDIWIDILNAFYHTGDGLPPIPTWKQAKNEGRELIKAIHRYAQPIATKAEERAVYKTYASKLLDPSISNLKILTNLIENQQKKAGGQMAAVMPQLRGKGLKVPTFSATIQRVLGTQVERFPQGAIIPWALNVRQRDAARFIIREFAERYPEQVIKFRNTAAMIEGAHNTKALTDYYYKTLQKFVARDSNVVNKSLDDQFKLQRETIKEMVDSEELKTFAEKLAEKHLSLIQTITPAQFKDTFADIAANVAKEGTEELGKEGLRGAVTSVNNNYAKQLMPFTSASNNAFDDFINAFDMSEDFKIKFRNKWGNELSHQIKPAMIGQSIEEQINFTPLLGMQYTFMGEMNKAWRDFQMVNGARVGHIMRDDINQYAASFKQFPDAPIAFAVPYGTEAVKLFEEMNNIIFKKDIIVDDVLKILDKEGGPLVWSILKNTMDSGRKAATAGMLAGPFLPGLRYLAINVLSAPLIMANTIGRLGMTMLNPFTWIKRLQIARGNPNEFAFKDTLGRTYTKGEVRYLMTQYNTGMTEEMVHFANGTAQNIMKDANIQLNGVKMGWASWLKSKIDWRDYNIFSKFATFTDQQIRDAIFTRSLMNGNSVTNSADLARRSLLDYGAIDPAVANELNKYINFFRFRLMMMSESLNALSRAVVSGKPTVMTASIKANMAMQRQAEDWLYADDSLKSRIFLGFREMFINETNSLLVGPAHPTVEAYEGMINTSFMFVSLAAGEARFADVVRSFLNHQYRPGLEHLKDIIETTEDKSEKSYAPRLRDDLVPALQAVPPLWSWIKDTYLTEQLIYDDARYFQADRPLYPSQRRGMMDKPAYEAGSREYEFVQYRFKDMKAYESFKNLTLVLTAVGIDRTIRDYSKAYMASQSRKVKKQKGDAIVEETIYPYGRYSTPSGVGYLMAIETSMPTYKRDIDSLYKLDRLIREYEYKTKKR